MTEETAILGAVAVHAGNMDWAVLIGILDRVIPTRSLRATRASIEARIAEKRECVRESLRIELGKRLELQRILAANGQCAEVLVAHAAKKNTVEGLTTPAAVSVRSLTALLHTAILSDAQASISQVPRQRIEARLEPCDQGPILSDWLRDPYADFGLLEAALSGGRHRPREVTRGGERLILKTAWKRTVERNALTLVGVADIDRAIDGHAAK